MHNNAGLPVITPEEVGLSSARLDRIDPVMQGYVDQGRLAGLSTMVARRGKIAHFKCFGMMDREAEKPMKPDTIFRIYSMTKPITSVAIMMLYEEGLFQLDAPVSKLIPEFEDLEVSVNETESGPELADLECPITIRHLLTHTSGLIHRPKDHSSTLRDMIQKLAELPLTYQPGSVWKYGISTDVLGYLVEVMSGQSFDVFLKEQIFQPLEMVDTGFYVPEDKLDRFAAMYRSVAGGSIEVIDNSNAAGYMEPPTFFSGAGGLVSTMPDYMRFAQMLLNKGELDGARLLGRRTVEFMTMNHLSTELYLSEGLHPFKAEASGFGLGFGVVMDSIKAGSLVSEGSFSWAGAAGTVFWVDPEEEIIGLIMPQILGAQDPYSEKFRTLIYQAIID